MCMLCMCMCNTMVHVYICNRKPHQLKNRNYMFYFVCFPVDIATLIQSTQEVEITENTGSPMPDASPTCDVPKIDSTVTGALPAGDEVNNDVSLTEASPGVPKSDGAVTGALPTVDDVTKDVLLTEALSEASSPAEQQQQRDVEEPPTPPGVKLFVRNVIRSVVNNLEALAKAKQEKG